MPNKKHKKKIMILVLAYLQHFMPSRSRGVSCMWQIWHCDTWNSGIAHSKLHINFYFVPNKKHKKKIMILVLAYLQHFMPSRSRGVSCMWQIWHCDTWNSGIAHSKLHLFFSRRHLEEREESETRVGSWERKYSEIVSHFVNILHLDQANINPECISRKVSTC